MVKCYLRLSLLTVLRSYTCFAFECRYIGSFFVNRQRAYTPGNVLIGRIKQSRDDDIIDNTDANDSNRCTDALGTTVIVSYEGNSCDIQVLPNESILSALERQSMYVRSQLTTLPDMPPSDCRRGNCMTCAAFIVNNSHQSQSSPLSLSSQSSIDNEGGIHNLVVRTEDNGLSPAISKHITDIVVRTEDNGLSPAISKHITDRGYILTCSSFLMPPSKGDDAKDFKTIFLSNDVLRLELGVQNEIWNEVYSQRFTTPETQLIARTAMARVLRQSAERNPQEWIQSTERVLRQTETE